jgi:hypothetical protein
VHTWPPSCPKGGDKEPERLLNESLKLLDQAAQLRQMGKIHEANIAQADAAALRARSGL